MRYVAMAAVCILAAGAALHRSASDAAIGVADVGKALSKYEKWRDMQKVLSDRRSAQEKEIQALAREVAELREALEKLDPSAKEYVQKQGLLIQKEAILETRSQQYEIERRRSEQQQYDAVVNGVIAAVGDLAKELGLSVVIQRTLETPEGVWESVLYAEPYVDLTDRLVTYLNEKYEAERK